MMNVLQAVMFFSGLLFGMGILLAAVGIGLWFFLAQDRF
jgi:hypothetical protein